MKHDILPEADRSGIIRALPQGLSEANRKRLTKFGSFMFMYEFIQNRWVRPRIHKANSQRHRKIMHGAIAPIKEAVVLDIACGTGSAIPHFDCSNAYWGVDLSYAMLRQAVKKARAKGFRHYAIIEGTAEELLFEDQSFDFALIDTSLHMIPEYRRCISEAARVLKKGGNLMCSCPTVGIDREFDSGWAKIAPKRHLHSLTEPEFQAVCSSNGLRYKRIETNGGVLYFRALKVQ
jgi:ubiquinone/menaquinone biosynthesis C-methylase UbiE